ncbi:naiP_3 [Blepharisma stoltei]|uniref:Major facilitator superfamily (MFS) profile domain-containing protein n=1 Tax=Blepharisma stoltei TaxID=1481888 RepID=A0AAU9J7A8_9CILI|nr:unnamed protein product [Blepharisma stoltei]
MTQIPTEIVVHYLDEIGWGKYQWSIFEQCMISYFNIQFRNLSIGYFAAIYAIDLGISNTQKGLMGTLFQLGCFIGSYFWGNLSDRHGRASTVKKAGFIFIFVHLVWIFADNIFVILILCFASGFGNTGEMVIIPVLFKEFCPTKKLNFITKLTSGFAIGGAFIAFSAISIEIIGSNYLPDWCFMAIILLFCHVLMSILRIGLDETPGFLASKGKFSQTEELLSKIAKINGKDSISISISPVDNTNAQSVKAPIKMKAIFSKKYVKSTVFVSIIYFFIYFGSFSMNLFMPRFLQQFSFAVRYTIILIQQLSGIPGIFLASFLVNTKLGRKHTLLLSLAITSFSVYLFIFLEHIVAVIIVIMMLASVNFASFGSLFTLSPEIYPTEIRNSAMGFFFTWSRIGSSISPFIGGMILDIENGKEVALALFASGYLIASLSTVFIEETRPSLKTTILIEENSPQ